MFGGIIGGIVSSVVGSAVSSLAGNLLGGLISQFGGGNVFGALTNLALDSLGGAIKDVINKAPVPQFLKDAANNLVDNVMGQNEQPTTPDCQCAVSNAYGEAMQNAANGVAADAGEEAEGKTGGNWLVALAGALAEVQGKFLHAAMDNLQTMNENADKTAQGGDEGGTANSQENKDSSQEFLEAQSQYQANMQMFNMMANASATSLKSIGEGLTALARKQ